MLDWGLASNAAFLFQRILQRSHYYERGTRSISRGQDRGEAHSTASPPSNQALLAAVAAAEQLAELCQQAGGTLAGHVIRLRKGWFAIDAPQVMTVGQAYTIRAAAMHDWIQGDLAALGLDSRQAWETVMARIVRVQLIADSGEDISIRPLSDDEQPVLDGDTTLWEWLAIPRRVAGPQHLRLTMGNRLTVEGRELIKSLPVKTLSIRIVDAEDGPFDSLTADLEMAPAQLRKCIGHALRSSSDLDAFCSDYFQPVYARFTDGMDRVARVSCLLQNADSRKILAKLREDYSHVVY